MAERINFTSMGTARCYLTPPVDICETEQEVVVIADMPGVSKERMQVEITNNQLTILGRFHTGWTGAKLVRECPNCDYYRTFRISDTIDAELIKAKMTDGTLTLTLPKKPSAQPYQILIETEE